jgi:nucleoside-diphosphate-sugar epimerase
MSERTIAVTGANGTIGRAIVADLNEHGYRTVNVARGDRREEISDAYETTDLLVYDEVHAAFERQAVDGVIHMGTINGAGPPEHVVYESNAMSSCHVLEAAAELDIEHVCLPSSINVMGSLYQDPPTDVRYLPVDEAHPLTPRDPYALGKEAIERLGAGFGRRNGAPLTVAALRYPWVATGEQLEERYTDQPRTLADENTREPAGHRDELYSYLHMDDAAAIARLTMEATYDGFEPFWAVAADTTMETPTPELIADGFADATVEASFDTHEALIDISKAERLLGWTPERTWRDLS